MYKLCIVDDEEKIRALIKKYALFEGYEVKEAENGMQAIEMCQRENFDLVVMDIMMPELDGFSACKKLGSFQRYLLLCFLLEVRSMIKFTALK